VRALFGGGIIDTKLVSSSEAKFKVSDVCARVCVSVCLVRADVLRVVRVGQICRHESAAVVRSRAHTDERED
jgi:hypothetical protein